MASSPRRPEPPVWQGTHADAALPQPAFPIDLRTKVAAYADADDVLGTVPGLRIRVRSEDRPGPQGSEAPDDDRSQPVSRRILQHYQRAIRALACGFRGLPVRRRRLLLRHLIDQRRYILQHVDR